MAAGLGFKDFTTGEVLTAADVDGYLMQGVWVFASAAARDAAVTSPQEGNFAYLKDTNVTTYYTGSAWANLDTTGMTNPMTTTGDTIYSLSGSTPARLGIGTAGQVLQVNSGATAPEWATPASGGGMTQLAAANFPTGVATFDITSISGSYKNLQLVLRDFDTVDDVNLLMRFNSNTGSNYPQSGIKQTGESAASAFAQVGTGFFITEGDVDSTAGENQLIITIFDYANSTTYKTATAIGIFKDGGAAFYNTYYTTMGWKVTDAITSITIYGASNFDAGSYVLYGVK